jgi:hypothetical protein
VKRGAATITATALKVIATDPFAAWVRELAHPEPGVALEADV